MLIAPEPHSKPAGLLSAPPEVEFTISVEKLVRGLYTVRRGDRFVDNLTIDEALYAVAKLLLGAGEPFDMGTAAERAERDWQLFGRPNLNLRVERIEADGSAC